MQRIIARLESLTAWCRTLVGRDADILVAKLNTMAMEYRPQTVEELEECGLIEPANRLLELPSSWANRR